MVLDPLDHFIKEDLRCKGHVGYVDDLALFHSDKGFLHHALEQIKVIYDHPDIWFLCCDNMLSIYGARLFRH